MFAGLALLLYPTLRAGDIALADFEGRDYGAWRVSGSAFGTSPAPGTLPNQMDVTGFQGHGLANSFVGGDSAAGTLTSPSFKIDRPYIKFLIGGGGWSGKTCMNLIVDGKIVRTATGPNIYPGGTEALAPASWDVREFKGRTAQIQIVDHATGGWGHINVDQIVLTDRAPVQRTHKQTMKIEKRYVNLPVSNNAPLQRVSVTVAGKVVREFEIKLADGKPDFWAFLDLAAYKGQTAGINATGLKSSDTLPRAYGEPLRPQFHFSSRVGWLNDPNGLVYYKGEYHLFYQHNPYGWDWGNMHWGHAVSPDLVHWQELPIALYPHQFGDWVFSGSAAVDGKNSGGFKTGKNDVLVAAYTSTGRGECIAYSNDRGRTFSEPTGNPIIKHQGRDPRLFWYEPKSTWVIAVYDEQPNEPTQGISFYTSTNLKDWQFQSRIGGFFECPDIFALPLDGHTDQMKWVLTAANSEYMVGKFDGHAFTPETTKLPGHRGDAFYAAQTFNDVEDHRRIQVGWSTIATPGMPFNQMMAFPCDLTLKSTPDGPRLAWNPVKIDSLYAKSFSASGIELVYGQPYLPRVAGDLLDISAQLGTTTSIKLIVHGMPVVIDATAHTITCAGKTNRLNAGGDVKLRILVDRTSIEIFADDGMLYMPMAGKFVTASSAIEFAGSGTIKSLEIHELKSAWR